MRVFEAFAGYGSQALALERLKQNFPDFDYRCVGFSEIEDAAIKAYNLLHPNVPNFGDITKIDWEQVPDFDLFTYSSPCTDFSQAGLQKGGEEGSGTRSSLLWECRRAIVSKKPKFLLLENVAALVSAKFLPLFNKWREELASYSYDSFAQVLNAKNFGVPQNRERIFLVSIRDDGENPQFYFPEPFKLQTCLADVLEEDVEQKYFLKDEMVAKFLKANEKDPMVYVPTDHFLSDEEIERAIYEQESEEVAEETAFDDEDPDYTD